MINAGSAVRRRIPRHGFGVAHPGCIVHRKGPGNLPLKCIDVPVAVVMVFTPSHAMIGHFYNLVIEKPVIS
jgi:hypothetical protein